MKTLYLRLLTLITKINKNEKCNENKKLIFTYFCTYIQYKYKIVI